MTPPHAVLPLRDVKVVDLTWSAAGPIATTWLAEFGATVVHVESRTRLDVGRKAGPFPGGLPNPDTSATFTQQNCSKLGITLDLNVPKALAVMQRLLRWTNLFIESFTPGVVQKWSLDYESVRQLNPGLVYLSSSGQGQYGPAATGRFFGTHLASLAGFTNLTGWPDRGPSSITGAYTDPISARMSTAIMVAALDYQRRTGQGSYIDLSQVEAGLQFLAPLILAQQSNANPVTRIGDRSRSAAPHGAYPTQGDDRWIAISVSSQLEWEALRHTIADAQLTTDPRFKTLLGRKANEDALDRIVSAWTATWEGSALMKQLQQVGVPAGVLNNLELLFNDPQLRHRKHHVRLRHSAIGFHTYDSPGIHLSATPGGPRLAAPTLGEHTEHILRDLLDYNDAEIAELAIAGALE